MPILRRTAHTAALLLLAACAWPAAQAQGPTPAPNPVPAPTAKPLTEDEAKAQFATADAARAADEEGTEERAKAAEQAEIFARIIAWDEFDAGHYDEAANWFSRRTDLNREHYASEIAFYKAVRKPESDRSEVEMAQIITKGQAQMAAATDAKQKALWQRVSAGFPSMRHAPSINYLSAIEMQAAAANDLPTQLDCNQQVLALRRATLAEMRQVGLPPEKIVQQQVLIANTLGLIGDGQRRLAQFDAAERTDQEALALRRSLPADAAERNIAESLSDLAGLYSAQGDLPRARDSYEQAMKAIEDNQPALQKALAAGPTPEQAGLPQKDVEESLGVYRQSLIIDDIERRGGVLNNLGSVVQDMGDYQAALTYFNRAVAVNETLPADGPLIAMLGPNVFASVKAGMIVKNISNIVVAHADSGEIDPAIQGELTVLGWDKRLGEETATDLVNLGSLYSEKGDAEKARLYTEQAQKEFAANQDLRGVIGATLELASLASNAGQLSKTEEYARAALTTARTLGDLSWRGSAARQLAGVRIKQGRLDEADALLTEAETADAQVGAPLSSEKTADLQGRALEARGQNEAALTKYKAAINLLEQVRATTTSATDFSNIKSTYRVYERIVTLLLKMGRTEEAFDYYNRAQSSQLQDSLQQSSLKTRDPALQALLDRIQSLKVQQKTLQAQLQAQQSRPKADRDPDVIKSLQYRIAATTNEVLDATDEIQNKYPNVYPSIVAVTPTALSNAQPAIPPDVVLIEYAPLGDQVYILVVTHDTLKLYASPVKPEALYARIRAVRAQLAAPDSTAPTARGTAAVSDAAPGPSLTDNLAALYDMLITPVASEIAAKKTLAFIPTQLLSYLPMQALGRKEGGGLHYLIQDKEIVYLAGANILNAIQPHPAAQEGRGLMAFGNPTGANLPFAQSEVDAIGRIFPASTTYSGAQATKDAIKDVKSQNVRILHFATHGYLDSLYPHKSYIFLANGDSAAGRLTFGEIEMLHLGKVDLVTLSACQTALQGQEPTGTEVASLAEAFTRAKAHTVVASLWSVADESTQTLMVSFYKNLAAGQSKAAALRAAQLQLLHDPRTRHPYYWAAFILMGDWK